jgi:hypothetical protein
MTSVIGLGFKLGEINYYIKDLETSIKVTRERLAYYSTSSEWRENKVDELQGTVYRIARQEADLRVLTALKDHMRYRDATKDEPKPWTKSDIYRTLLEDFVLRGADYAWSGRGNDLKRVIFDAHREAVEGLKHQLRD